MTWKHPKTLTKFITIASIIHTTTVPKVLYVIVCIIMVNTWTLLACNDLHAPHIITTNIISCHWQFERNESPITWRNCLWLSFYLLYIKQAQLQYCHHKHVTHDVHSYTQKGDFYHQVLQDCTKVLHNQLD